MVWKRKRQRREAPLSVEAPTAILSLNQFLSSYLAFFSFFFYGACLQPFNHYLVWPRLAATLLTLAVLYEIMADRRAWLPTLVFIGGAALLAGAPTLLLFNPHIATAARRFSQGLIIAVTVILAQGYSHQIVLIRQSGQTGAVSLRLHQFFLVKDLSTIAFASAMGLASGWPVLLLSSVSGITKLATIWHFHWARVSPVAQQRRDAVIKLTTEESPSARRLAIYPPPTA